MGSVTGDANEKPARRVTISRPFYIGIHEVTQRQYQAVMGENPSGFKGDDLPVEMIAWEDAVKYCERLSQREQRKFRLPTEAEWEYACRGGTTSAWSFGELQSQVAEYGWCQENAANKTYPVGQKLTNPLGLYDMHGNVWEFCSDWYGAYPAAAEQDPSGPISGPYRVFRGGSYFFPSGESRSSNRPDKRFPAKGSNLGFRVVAETGALPGK
jgi:formylglycine-generating enzyme required for sulfatase activity